MQGPETVKDALLLLGPMFATMLNAKELPSLAYELVSVNDPFTGSALDPHVLLSSQEAVVRWRVLGGQGWTGGLRISESPDVMVRFVQSDLQDWISESESAWGQLRGPRDLPSFNLSATRKTVLCHRRPSRVQAVRHGGPPCASHGGQPHRL